MGVRFTIGRKIGTGFGILILLVLGSFFLTLSTLQKSRTINEEINRVYTPSVSVLEELNLMIVRSQKLISKWVHFQSSNDNAEKRELRTLVNNEYPQLRDRILELSKSWNKTDREKAGTIFSMTETLFDDMSDIMDGLNSFDSYEDPGVVFLYRNSVDEGDVYLTANMVLEELHELIEVQHRHASSKSTEMDRSIETLDFMLRAVGINLVVGGLLIALLMGRSIVRPVHQLKKMLLSMARGVLPGERIEKRTDEIGEMSKALELLIDGMRRTTEFAREVGAGNFESKYQPLSEEDTLGQALLKMRTDLAENERVLEQKVIERTEEVMRQKVELEKQRDDLAKLSIVASKTDNQVMIANVDGSIEYINETFMQFRGLTLEEMQRQGQASVYTLSNNPQINEIIAEIIRTKRSGTYETLNKSRDGREVWMQTTLTPILDDNGNVRRLVFIDTDINEMKLAEEEIRKQRDEIQIKSIQLQHAYKDIKDSIQYAKRIQEAILPPDALVKKLLPGSFIYYRPKDIVSGDFYWLHEKGGKIYFAAVDCTGHGVPGAFMSIVGYNILQKVVESASSPRPADILEELNKGVTQTLHKSLHNESPRDGMDLSLCCLDYKTMELQFSGANNPLYLIRNGELKTYKADKRAIGTYGEESIPFTSHAIRLSKGDAVYIFSDGYVDQFGGPRSKKFMARQFRKMLLDIHPLPPEQQRHRLDRTIEEWKGINEQVDDILVIGLKV